MKETTTTTMRAHPLDERPPLPPPKGFEPPAPTVFTLPNGIPVWWLERPDLPLLSIRLVLHGGAAEDPPDQPGLAALTDQVMQHGAGSRDATEFAAFSEQQAIGIGTSTSGVASVVHAESHADKLALALDLLADVVLRPRLEAAELERVRTLQVGAILQDLDDPQAVAPWVSGRLYFGDGHPRAHPSVGTVAGLSRVTLAAVRASWQRRYTASRAHFVVVGAVGQEALMSALASRFSGWGTGPLPAPIPPPAGVKGGPALYLLDNPGASQSTLRVLMPGWPADHPELSAGDLAALALGGTFTSRLNTTMREEKGYTYGAGTAVHASATYGTVVSTASVEQGATAEALLDMLTILRDAATTGFSAEELTKAREANRTEVLESMGSRARTAGALCTLIQQRRPADTLARDLVQDAAVDLDALLAAWTPRADLSSALILVAGDLREIQDSVVEAFPGDWIVVDRAACLGEGPA